MAGRKVVQAIGPSYQIADRKAGVQRAVNLRVRVIEGEGEPNMLVLESVEGLRPFLTMPATDRGTFASDRGRFFVVAGNTLYEVTASGAYTARGTLASSSGFVCMENNNTQLIVVDGPNGYLLTFASNAFGQITDPDWRGSRWVEELNGSFVLVPDDQPDQFYLSGIDDGATYDALDFSSSDAQPDDIVTHRVMKQELYLFNQRSTEVWVYSGDADFPLVRYNSTPIDIGCVGLRAAVVTSDSMFWVGGTGVGSGVLYEMRGHSPARVSTDAVEQALAASTDISKARIWCYQIEGAEFIGLDAPGFKTTWVYNLATQKWHEQARLVDGDWQQWPAELISYFSGKHYAAAGDKLYVIDNTLTTIGAEQMSFERTWPHLVLPSLEPVNYRGLEVSMTTGNGGAVTLEISNDGGAGWGSPLRRSLGAIGRRMERIRWLGLGSAVDRVFRLRWLGAGPTTIYSASVDA